MNLNPTHTVQELALVVAVKNHDPLVLNEAFLKQTGIVPDEWQLSQNPYVTSQASQLVFNNGVSIVAETERVVFAQALGDRELSSIEIGDVASKYSHILKKLDYEGVGLNFRSFFSFDSQEEVQAYIERWMFAPASWQHVGEAPVRANISLNFTLAGKKLTLSINPAAIQFPESEPMPVVLFGANFGYQLEAEAEKLPQLDHIFANWKTDLIEYQQLIDRHFLPTESKQLAIKSDNQDAIIS
jgi:hypothetical protein